MKRAARIFLFAVLGFLLGVTAAFVLGDFFERTPRNLDDSTGQALPWLEIICPGMGLLGAAVGGFIGSRRLKK
jgi:hypothetical protein